MPLAIASAEALSIPESAFNANGLAVLMVPGGRYGGDWSISFVGPDDAKIGSIFTSAPERSKRELQSDRAYPDRAIETAFIWLVAQAREQGMRVVGFECLNGRYAEAERPYFCLAQAVVASEAFVPHPGVTYADEHTLDAVMGYVRQGDPS